MKNLTLTLLFVFTNLCFSQKQRIEIKLMDCWYNSLGKKSKIVKEFIKEYNQSLIEEKILKDTTSKSYLAIYKSFENNQEYKKPSKSFFEELYKMNLKLDDFIKNSQKILKDTLRYDVKKYMKFESTFDSVIGTKDYTRKDIAKGIISVLDEKDFNLEYYRIRTFLIFDYIILSEIWDINFLKKSVNTSKHTFKNAFSIHIDKYNKIYIEANEVDLENCKN